MEVSEDEPALAYPSIEELQRRGKDVIRGGKCPKCNFKGGFCCVADTCQLRCTLAVSPLKGLHASIACRVGVSLVS